MWFDSLVGIELCGSSTSGNHAWVHGGLPSLCARPAAGPGTYLRKSSSSVSSGAERERQNSHSCTVFAPAGLTCVKLLPSADIIRSVLSWYTALMEPSTATYTASSLGISVVMQRWSGMRAVNCCVVQGLLLLQYPCCSAVAPEWKTTW